MADVLKWDPLGGVVLMVLSAAYRMERKVSRHLVIGILCEKHSIWSSVVCTLGVGLIHIQSREGVEGLWVRRGLRLACTAQTLLGVK